MIPKPPKRGPKPPKPLPRPTRPIRQRGKQAQTWAATRREWLRLNPPDYRGMWRCAGCGIWMEHIEVDHVVKRSVAPQLRYEQSNLQGLCPTCHRRKDGGQALVGRLLS